jgi:hypothetical protein
LGLPVASAGNQAYSAFSDGSGDNFSVPPRHQTDGQFVYCQSIDGASRANSKMARFQRPSRKVSDYTFRSDRCSDTRSSDTRNWQTKIREWKEKREGPAGPSLCEFLLGCPTRLSFFLSLNFASGRSRSAVVSSSPVAAGELSNGGASGRPQPAEGAIEESRVF